MNKMFFIAISLITSALFASTYEYDTLNRLTKVTYDGGFQIVYSYDEVGNRTERIATIAPDVFADGIVNLQDFAALGDYWMENNCGIPDWCNRADIDESSSVGFTDLGNIAEFWLAQSTVQLTTSVVGGHGSLLPASGGYAYGTTASLIAIPDDGYFVKLWTGTNNDSSENTNNTVMMNANKSVTVEFEYNTFLNGGFEMGDLTYWNVTSSYWGCAYSEAIVNENPLTEGSCAAYISAYGCEEMIPGESPEEPQMILQVPAEIRLQRTVVIENSGTYRVSFDYLGPLSGCYTYSAYMVANGNIVSLSLDGEIHSVQLDINATEPFNLEFYLQASGLCELQMTLDNVRVFKVQ
ncbi:MAG: hypothetical protein WCW64_00785 [Phycisphaerae bacterium]|jgi:YD repeat-containing protein